MMILQIGMLVLSFLILGPVHAQQAEQMNMDILKEKIKADKKLIVATNMTLTDAEAKNFWPLYL
jgi:recombinational DNA repair protein RecR